MKTSNSKKIQLIKLACIQLVLLISSTTLAQIDPGMYTIKLASAATMLDASWADMDTDGCKVQTCTYLARANQHWKIVKSSLIGTYNIRLASTGRPLDAAWNERFTNGGRIILWSFNDGESQRWRVERISGNRYRIRLAISNKLLSGTGSVDGSRVQLWDDLANTTQEWIIEKVQKITVSDKYVDLRPNQTGIRNQSPRTSCTVFGATAALEAAYKKAGYGNLDLSEEFMALQGKAFYLKPNWASVPRGGTENQLAGTGGGGTALIFKNGFAVPSETYVPYQPTAAADAVWTRPEYQIQKNVDSFNFRLNTPNVLKAPKYYGASSVVKITDYRNPAEYERLLRLGYEIPFNVSQFRYAVDIAGDGIWRYCDTCADPGAHKMMIVGFDKTDPNPINHYFIVKNSWGPSGIAGSEGFNYMHYGFLNYVSDAEYIVSVNSPKKWTELGLIGEYSLDFDGWRGRLDIYHLPGIHQWGLENDGVAGPDRRLGIYYDQSGNSFRVNGALRRITSDLLEVTFYINSSNPNPQWDELAGRKFVYYYDYKTDFIAGFHTDPGSTTQIAGYAIKARNRFIVNNSRTPRPFSLASYKNSSWNLDISSGPKGKLYISQSGTTLFGSFYDNATRSLSAVSIAVTGSSFNQMEFRFGSYALKAQHLTWENGLMAGYDLNSKKPFYMVRQSPQVPVLTWTRIGSPLLAQATDVCACNDGSLYTLRSDKRLYKSTAGGNDSSWLYTTTLPSTTRQIACARNLLYYHITNATGGNELWYLDGSTPRRAATLTTGGILAGTEDNTLDFPYLYLQNQSTKELFRSSTSGVSWTRIGQPLNAIKISATQNAIYSLNTDGTFLINRYGGSDANWVKVDLLSQAKDITSTSLGQTGKSNLYYLHQDGSLWRTMVYDNTLGYNARFPIGALEPVPGVIIEPSLTVSPNPASDVVKIIAKGQRSEKLHLQLQDITGKLIKQYQGAGWLNEQVNVSMLSKGTYLVTLYHSKGKITKKLLVK